MGNFAALCVVVLACCATTSAQTSVLNSNSQANATYAAYNGYNATGFMDTNAYYGPYSHINTTTDAAPKPNVSLSVQPEGCTILSRQFGIANYTGDLTCSLPGDPPSDSKQACVVRACNIIQRFHVWLEALCCIVQTFLDSLLRPVLKQWLSHGCLILDLWVPNYRISARASLSLTRVRLFFFCAGHNSKFAERSVACYRISRARLC